MFSNACRVSKDTLTVVPGNRTWKFVVLGKSDRIATTGVCLFLENKDGEAGRVAPFTAPSEGGRIAGERDLVKVRLSYILDGLLLLELLDSDWPLPCLVRNAPLPWLSLLDGEPIRR